jgi:hypothetical protein
LDEDWVEDKLRLQLIRALIETGLEFTKISNVKVIISLRSDLLDRVYRFTRDPGFQEEKYRTSSIDLTWPKDKLIEVLDRRVDKLVKGQYTKQSVTCKDLLRPIRISKRQTIQAVDYMIERTLFRSRDLIQFFNICISQADGKTVIDPRTLITSEGIYSRERFRALVDEWIGIYPNLAISAQILKKRNQNFKVLDISLSDIEEHCLQAVTSLDAVEGSDIDEMTAVAEGKFGSEMYRKNLVLVLYKVGLIGIRTNGSMPISWSFLGSPSVSGAEIEGESRVYIHPTFWRHFGISDNNPEPND